MMEYDVMILATIQTYFLLMSWFGDNAPWHVMTDLFASSRFICGFGGGKYSYCVLV